MRLSPAPRTPATRGLRLGHGRGPTALGVLAAAVLLAALIVTGHTQPGAARRLSAHADHGAAAADRIGGRIACPPARPVLATSDGSNYPPGHPGEPPLGADPVACFPTAEQATAAGYALAPLPAGVLELGGVLLIPAGSQFHGRCRQAADRLGFAVPCPTLLPARPPTAAPLPILCDPRFLCVPEVGFLFEEEGFVVPPGYVGVDGRPHGRLAIAAARQETAFPVACLGGRTVASVQVRGMPGRLLECPPDAGAHDGGMLLRWREKGVVMAVSLSGHTLLNRRLVLALVACVELVLPGKKP